MNNDVKTIQVFLICEHMRPVTGKTIDTLMVIEVIFRRLVEGDRKK